MADLHKCKACGAQVLLVETLKGKTVPLDPDPRDDGNVVLDNDGRARWLSRTVRQCRSCGCTEKAACRTAAPGLFDDDTPMGCSWVERDLCSECVGRPVRRYASHYATCANATWKVGTEAERVARTRAAVERSIERGETAQEFQLRRPR